MSLAKTSLASVLKIGYTEFNSACGRYKEGLPSPEVTRLFQSIFEFSLVWYAILQPNLYCKSGIAALSSLCKGHLKQNLPNQHSEGIQELLVERCIMPCTLLCIGTLCMILVKGFLLAFSPTFWGRKTAQQVFQWSFHCCFTPLVGSLCMHIDFR